MRFFATALLVAGFTLGAIAQTPVPATKGVTYGAGTTSDGAISVNELSARMSTSPFTGKITGKVVEVCKEKGCWMKIEREGADPLMVKFKDYGFFMPTDIEGKDVVLDGEAQVKEVSVKQQRHYAKDAGKSEEEIQKIKASKKETQFVAKGVLVL